MKSSVLESKNRKFIYLKVLESISVARTLDQKFHCTFANGMPMKHSVVSMCTDQQPEILQAEYIANNIVVFLMTIANSIIIQLLLENALFLRPVLVP